MIATDPPFNKGRDFHATPSSLASGASFQDRWSWEDDVHEEWTDKLENDFPNIYHVIQGSRKSYGDDMGAFLCFMGVRLVEMKRVMKPSGSIYLHCDPTASHYLKELMDAVFGVKNFRNEIIWHYGKMNNSIRNFAQNHDVILRYSVSEDWVFNAIPRGESQYKTRYRKVVDSNNQILFGYVKNRSDKLLDLRIKKVEKRLKRNLIDSDVLFDFDKERMDQDDVMDIPIIRGNSRERTGYPTQKPIALYENIIRASSNKGDIVLDPFCGCATTLIAAEKLDRQWVGMDIWKQAPDVVKMRLRNEGLLHDDKSVQLGILAQDITFTTTAPERTDDGLEAVPFLAVKEKTVPLEPPGRKMTRKEMVAFLMERDGKRCKGCNRDFGDDTRYLQLDHNTPRSQGGLNHESNRMLLCGPCNQMKSDRYTLKWLQQENKKRGYWQA